MSNIYLVGMMGSGKSVTGKSLARLLGCGFVDLDEWIQERTKKTIVEIFEKEGEEFFREKESEVLREVAGAGPRVVATGGGTVVRPENVRRMKETGKIIYLETSLAMLWDRVKGKKDRPRLKGPDPLQNLTKLYEARRALYLDAADEAVDTDGQTAEAVALRIMEKPGIAR